MRKNNYSWRVSPNHPHCISRNRIYEHIAVVEDVLGKYLPKDAVVHHINGIRHDNTKHNLVVCQDKYYHELLHLRQNALKACGNVNWRKCQFCKEYDSVDNLTICKRSDHNGISYRHPLCYKLYREKGGIKNFRRNSALLTVDEVLAIAGVKKN